MKLLIILVVVIAGYLIAAEQENKMWNFTATDTLKRDLLLNYDKFARPEHHSHATKVGIKLTIRHIDLDETKSTMTTHSWIKLNWTDSKLKWIPADYGNLSVLHVGDHEVWQPDLTLYNSAAGSAIDHYGNTHCLLYHIGSVLWVPPSKFDTFCALDLKFWPFDTQTCSIIIGSWTYSGFQIELSLDNDPIDLEHYLINGEWEIIKTASALNSKFYSCCEEPYLDATYNITIQRRAPMFKTIAVAPALVLIVMTLSSFWLPPLAGEKLLINGVSAIIICMLLMYFSQILPVLAIQTPIIVIFYSTTLYLICFSIIISVIVINFSRNNNRKSVPWFIKKNILEGPIASFFGTTLQTSSEQKEEVEELRETPFDHGITEDHQIVVPVSKSYKSIQNEWIIFAIIIDRIMFVIYLITFFVLGFKYFY